MPFLIKFSTFDSTLVGFVAAAFAVLWFYVFWLHGVTNWILFWLPLVNITAFGLTLYLDRDLKSTVHEAENLNQLKYNYRAI